VKARGGWRQGLVGLAVALVIVGWAVVASTARAGTLAQTAATPTQIPVTVPVAVPGLGANVGGLAAGSEHSCVVFASGAVQCWGKNIYGQLGNGTTETSSSVVNVQGLSVDSLVVSAGENHSCAVVNTHGTPSPGSDGAKCWGDNFSGQLGDGTTVDRNIPVPVGGLTGEVRSVAAGGSHTCTLTSTGVWCSGANESGQLGNGTTSATPVPGVVQVSGLAGTQNAIVAGSAHSCALSQADDLRCWGDNGQGRLGNGTTDNASTPVAVTWPSGEVTPTAVAAGSSHTCAITSTGEATCWGFNLSGQLGDGTIVESSSPVYVVDAADPTGHLTAVTGIAAGNTHSCAVLSTGAVRCWGSNAFGQLGNNSKIDSLVPVAVTALPSATKVVAGSGYSCAVTTGGAVYCWGNVFPPTGPTLFPIQLPLVIRN
jgi:alpha-tubulin suppressor-like RCC1 family protein